MDYVRLLASLFLFFYKRPRQLRSPSGKRHNNILLSIKTRKTTIMSAGRLTRNSQELRPILSDIDGNPLNMNNSIGNVSNESNRSSVEVPASNLNPGVNGQLSPISRGRMNINGNGNVNGGRSPLNRNMNRAEGMWDRMYPNTTEVFPPGLQPHPTLGSFKRDK